MRKNYDGTRLFRYYVFGNYSYGKYGKFSDSLANLKTDLTQILGNPELQSLHIVHNVDAWNSQLIYSNDSYHHKTFFGGEKLPKGLESILIKLRMVEV